jgi:hypothetical protein
VNIEISEDIIEKTRGCKKNFSCLNGSSECLCEVEGSSGYDILYINPDSNRDCIYCTRLGTSSLCSCPARNEIYNRYKI